MFTSFKIVESTLPKIMIVDGVMPALSGGWKGNSLVALLFSGIAGCILLAVFLVAAWQCRSRLIR